MTESTLCDGFADDYSAYLDGELEPGLADELALHLETCALCRERLEALRRVDLLLGETGETLAPVPSSDLYARLQSRIAEAEARRPVAIAAPRRRRTAPPERSRDRRATRTRTGIAVAAAVAAGLALVLLPSSDTESPAGPAPGGVVAETQSERVAPEAATGELLASFDDSSEDEVVEIALTLDLETVEDFDVIANLDLLERLVALEGEAG